MKTSTTKALLRECSSLKNLPKVSKKSKVSRIVSLSDDELFSSAENSHVISRRENTVLNIVIHQKNSNPVQEISYRDILGNGLYIPPADHRYSVAQLAAYWNSPKYH